MATGAFALPHVYDYKAAVKHMYLREQPVTYKNADGKKITEYVYQKVQKTTALKGYLVMDNDGATSPTINPAFNGDDVNRGVGFDYGRNRGFLVVYNSKAYKPVRHAKILPAVLDATWIDTAFAKGGATTGLAEGTLYVGGDAIAPVRVQHDYLSAYGVLPPTQRANPPAVPALQGEEGPMPGMVAIADYVWTSVYLFSEGKEVDGYVNGPNWFRREVGEDDTGATIYASPFGAFEYAWDQVLPDWLKTGWVLAGDEDLGRYYTKAPVDRPNYFHDTWMNGAGVGKWFTKSGSSTVHFCCGIDDEEVDAGEPKTLESLAGNLKGGLFLCTENGIYARKRVGADVYTYDWFRDIEWEDQFNTARLTPAQFFADDIWQNDLWQDGFMEQETTDVIYGTWSIKYNKTFFDEKKGKAKYLPTYGQERVNHFTTQWGLNFGENTKLETLWKAIYGAAYALDKDVTLYDGTEIYSKTIANRANLPMLTPQFVKYYRLTVTPRD